MQGGPFEAKKSKFDLPVLGSESGNLSPRIFRRSKPAAEKSKIHRGRPITPNEQKSSTEEKSKASKVGKGFEGYLELVSYLYYGYLPTSSAAREAEYEEKEGKGDYKCSTLDYMLSPMRADLAYGLFKCCDLSSYNKNREVESEGSCSIRMRNMQIWQGLRKNTRNCFLLIND